MITSDQLKDVLDRADALYKYLKIDEKKMEYEEEDLRTQAPDFWEDQKRAEEQMKKVKAIKKWLDGYQEVRTAADELQLAFDFYKEEMVTEEEVDANYQKAIEAIEALELKNMLRQQEDPMECVLKINSGAGGTEAQDWAQMLMRMYQRWAEAHGYKVSIANLQDGDEAGIKSVTMQIEGGEYAYGYLKSENGVHRLVRVSPYNAQGKRMTSFASVFVTPLVDDTIEVYVAAQVPVVRTSTRWSRVFACAIGTPTLIRARKRKSSSRIPRPATSLRTRSVLWRCSVHSSTTVPCRSVWRRRLRLRLVRRR